ncbi:MAG TPA: hypothetical protein VFR18_21500 [Terriglobia bacterium]|nr:hypothetical protein [Terriglobia bacterium]
MRTSGTHHTWWVNEKIGQAYLKPGDEIVATIDGIGTLSIPVVAGPQPPAGMGSSLPPVNTYRR